MARLIQQLTEAKIRTLTKIGLHHDGAGLYLQIKPGGARSWIYRFRLNSRTRELLAPHSRPACHTRLLARKKDHGRAEAALIALSAQPAITASIAPTAAAARTGTPTPKIASRR